MTGDHLGSTGDHHVVDIAADHYFTVAIGGRHRVVSAVIAHQRLRADPAGLLLASVRGCWRQPLEYRQIPHQALADRLVVTAQPLGEPAATTLEQLLVQRREVRRPRYRHQQVSADPADQPFDLALVIPLTRTAEPVGKQVMGLQLAEYSRPLPRPIAQDTGHRQLRIVVVLCPPRLCGEPPRIAVTVTATGHISIRGQRAIRAALVRSAKLVFGEVPAKRSKGADTPPMLLVSS
jgi:hypothetical protein